MTIREEIGRNILFLRKRARVSREWLSLEAHITQAYLYEVEYGKANPTVELLAKIAFALDVPFEILFESDLPERYDAIGENGGPLSFQEIVYLRACLQSFRAENDRGDEDAL